MPTTTVEMGRAHTSESRKAATTVAYSPEAQALPVGENEEWQEVVHAQASRARVGETKKGRFKPR